MTTIFITARDDKSLYVPGIFEYLNTKINEYYGCHKDPLKNIILKRQDFYSFYAVIQRQQTICTQIWNVSLSMNS